MGRQDPACVCGICTKANSRTARSTTTSLLKCVARSVTRCFRLPPHRRARSPVVGQYSLTESTEVLSRLRAERKLASYKVNPTVTSSVSSLPAQNASFTVWLPPAAHQPPSWSSDLRLHKRGLPSRTQQFDDGSDDSTHYRNVVGSLAKPILDRAAALSLSRREDLTAEAIAAHWRSLFGSL
ncbi:Px [Sowbane mosaic virus]|uniref:Px n=1 Tax=Sowbane mosaic virus TaxID=378833 RepID=UPI0003D406FC|nr:Px [Sowbane mosaic virus]